MSPSPSEDATILVRREMPEPTVVATEAGDAAVFLGCSPIKTTDTEDGVAIIPAGAGRAVLAVADGVGGQAAGAQAASLALESLAECVHRRGPEEDQLRAAILDGFELGNRRVLETGSGGATTLAVLEIDGRLVRRYHVGDAVIIVVGQRGKVRHQTVAHSPVGYAVEAGLLCEIEAMHHRDRHLVSNVIGSPEMRIDVGPEIRMCPLDTAVLATDGLFDNLHVEEIIELTRKGPLPEAARTTRRIARQRMIDPRPGEPSKPDDLGFIIFRLHRRKDRATGTDST